MQHTLVVVAGPTAVGKTALCIELAQFYNTEIISCDSRQFFKEMSIGTAVPNKDELTTVPHHFIQSHSITQHYSVGMFERDCLAKLDQLFKTNNIVFMTGGSGMYIDAVCNGLDEFPDIKPEIREQLNLQLQQEGIESLLHQLKTLDLEYYNKVDKANPHRIIRALEICIGTGKSYSSFKNKTKKERPFRIIKIALQRDREMLYNRINLRVDLMLEAGLLEEVKSLYEFKNHNALQTVAYKELYRMIDGEWEMETAVSEIKKNTRRFAKRQMTWFRRDAAYHYFHPEQKEEIIHYIESQL